MGPSASHAGSPGISSERADQLLSALTTLRDLMVDPLIQQSLPKIVAEVKNLVPDLSPPQLPAETTEVDAAEAGLPAPANPGKGGKGVKPEVAAPAVKTEKIEEAPAPAAGVPEIVNSSTHRSEHARLTRKMATIDSSKYPEMARLWAGGRKETCLCFTFFLERFTFFPPFFDRLDRFSQSSLRRSGVSSCVTGYLRERTLTRPRRPLSSVVSKTRKWNAARNCSQSSRCLTRDSVSFLDCFVFAFSDTVATVFSFRVETDLLPRKRDISQDFIELPICDHKNDRTSWL